MSPPIFDPCSPPNIVIQPEAIQPTKGMLAKAGATLAPILEPTILPDCFPPPIASMHSTVLSVRPSGFADA